MLDKDWRGWLHDASEKREKNQRGQELLSLVAPAGAVPGTAEDRAEFCQLLEQILMALLDEECWVQAHFACNWLIKVAYKDRNDPGVLGKVIDYCQTSIAINQLVRADMLEESYSRWRALHSMGSSAATPAFDELAETPQHPGFKQLCIILEKQGDLEDAIEVCEQAAVSGWAGDWDARLTRLKRKLEKMQ